MYKKRTKAMIEQKNEKSLYRGSSMIGDVIRRKRLERNVTQQALSKGVCSVSYLSKIENGQIIPKEQTIQQISERLDLDATYLAAHHDASAFISEVVTRYFKGDVEGLGNTLERIKYFNDKTMSLLVKLTLDVIQSKWNRAKQTIEDLESHVGTMTPHMTELFLMLSCITSFETYDFQAAQSLSNTLKSIEIKNEDIRTLHHLYLAYIAYALGSCSSANHYCEEAVKHSDKHHVLKHHVTFELYRLHYTMKENVEVGKALLKRLDIALAEQVYPTMTHYVLGHVKRILGNRKEATNHFVHVMKISRDQWYARAVNAVLDMHKKDTKVYQNIRERMLDRRIEVNNIKEKVWFNQHDLKSDKDKKHYIITIAMPLAKQTGDTNAINEYTEWLINHARKTARYKEGLSSHHQRQKYLRRIKSQI